MTIIRKTAVDRAEKFVSFIHISLFVSHEEAEEMWV